MKIELFGYELILRREQPDQPLKLSINLDGKQIAEQAYPDIPVNATWHAGRIGAKVPITDEPDATA